jgi:hypothetical protein
MPVSPQDFALWSRYTGRQYPQSPAERMALAPEVYAFNKQLSRGQNPLMQAAEGIGSALDFAGRAALGTGLLVGAGLLAGKYLGSQTPRQAKVQASTGASAAPAPAQNISPVPEPVQEAQNQSVIRERRYPPNADMPKPTKLGTIEHLTAQAVETLEGSPGMSPEQASMAELARQSRQFSTGEALLKSETEVSDLDAVLAEISQSFAKRYAGKLQLDDEPTVITSTSQNIPNAASPLAQNIEASDHPSPGEINNPPVANQTAAVQALRGTSPAKPTRTPIEDKPVTQTEVLSRQQDSYPGTESEQLIKGEIQRGSSVPNTPVVDQAEGFRQTPQYAEMRRSAGVEIGPEEVIYSSRQPAVFTEVRPSPETRLTGAEPKSVESPIAAMSAAVTQAPQEKVTVAVQKPATTSPLEGVDPATIELARKALGHLPLEEAVAKLTQQKQGLIETVPTGASRVAKEGRITPNEFLSAMSQQKGPLAAYPISPERSKAVSNLTFYPGGEMGVTMKSGGRPQEFAYATADPYRLSMRDYAEEGYPETMGNIGSIAAGQGIAYQMGLQNRVEKGGMISEKRKPAYAGLMSDAEIISAGMGKPGKTRDRAMEIAQRHFETKEILNAFANKYPQPPMSPEEISRLREERSTVRRAGLS